MKRNILRIVVAVIACFLMGIIGLTVTIKTYNMSMIFSVATMGAFIMYEIQRSKKTD